MSRRERVAGMAVADTGVVQGIGVRGRAESPSNTGEKGPAEGPAGRVLLQGEKVAGSVRQGQVNMFSRTNCSFETGFLLP